MVQKNSCRDAWVSAQSQLGSHPWVSAQVGDPLSRHVGVSMLLSPSVWGHNAVTLCLALKAAICGSAGCVLLHKNDYPISMPRLIVATTLAC